MTESAPEAVPPSVGQQSVGQQSTGKQSTGKQSTGRRARDLNDVVRYTMWSVFRLRDVLGDADRGSEAGEVMTCSPNSKRPTSLFAACTTCRACVPTPT